MFIYIHQRIACIVIWLSSTYRRLKIAMRLASKQHIDNFKVRYFDITALRQDKVVYSGVSIKQSNI